MNTSIINAGYIDLSGTVVVSDPCYSRDVWCMATDVAVKPGRYVAYIAMKDEKSFGMRVAAIIAIHMDYVGSLKNVWEPYGGEIGVDSGQCGIFDDAIYPALGDTGGEYGDDSTFYGQCCKLTLGEAQGGILETQNGLVSSSGYGDGSYELLCQYHNGERVALMVDYALAKNSVIMRALLINESLRGGGADDNKHQM